jgi:membrane fusion protein, multidrug efflux system
MAHLLTPDAAAVPPRTTARPRRLAGPLLILLLLALAGGGLWFVFQPSHPAGPPAFPPAEVTVARPRQMTVADESRFLGQFSAVDRVELRAQVGGTLTAIHFTDGQIVHKGDPLFTIDPRPFRIRLDQAVAQLHSAQAREALTEVELWRARQLRQRDFGTVETVDQREADQRNAQAAIDTAQAAIRDATLDLEFAQVTSPFDGRIGAHQVSVGSLVAGSRGGTGPTTLLATLVSLDPIHFDFDMSEADYLEWRRAHPGPGAAGEVTIVPEGGGDAHRGTLDFMDNEVERSSGTIHARATVPNPDLSLTPGQFARLRLAMGPATPSLLVPEAALVPDQSRLTVMTLAPDGNVVPKPVTTGPLVGTLRVIRTGLSPEDRVIIDGLAQLRPGIRVHATDGEIPPPAADATR